VRRKVGAPPPASAEREELEPLADDGVRVVEPDRVRWRVASAKVEQPRAERPRRRSGSTIPSSSTELHGHAGGASRGGASSRTRGAALVSAKCGERGVPQLLQSPPVSSSSVCVDASDTGLEGDRRAASAANASAKTPSTSIESSLSELGECSAGDLSGATEPGSDTCGGRGERKLAESVSSKVSWDSSAPVSRSEANCDPTLSLLQREAWDESISVNDASPLQSASIPVSLLTPSLLLSSSLAISSPEGAVGAGSSAEDSPESPPLSYRGV
jgi:hypothetical protein